MSTTIPWSRHTPRNMLHGVPNAAIIEQDLLAPDEILADPALRNLIDFSQPTAVMFLSNMYFVSDEDDPAGLIARLLDPFPAGSHVAISHGTPVHRPKVNDVERVFDEETEQAHVRSRVGHCQARRGDGDNRAGPGVAAGLVALSRPACDGLSC